MLSEQTSRDAPERPPYYMFNVLSFTPREGEAGMPIVVHTHFKTNDRQNLNLRLVMGNRALSTKLDSLTHENKAAPVIYRLEGVVPPFEFHRTENPSVSVSIHVLNAEKVLHHITFGHFTYWRAGEFLHPHVWLPQSLTVLFYQETRTRTPNILVGHWSFLLPFDHLLCHPTTS